MVFGKLERAYTCGYPVFATITQGNAHIDRRVYEDERGQECVKINGNPYTVEELERGGKGVKVWF